jgi:hypothetical protein
MALCYDTASKCVCVIHTAGNANQKVRRVPEHDIAGAVLM